MNALNQTGSEQIDQIHSWHFSPENRAKLKTAQHATVDAITPLVKVALQTTSNTLIPVVPPVIINPLIEVCVDETAHAAKNNADDSIDLVEKCVNNSIDAKETVQKSTCVEKEEKDSDSGCIIL